MFFLKLCVSIGLFSLKFKELSKAYLPILYLGLVHGNVLKNSKKKKSLYKQLLIASATPFTIVQ